MAIRVRVDGEKKVQVAFRVFGKDVRTLTSAWSRISKHLAKMGRTEAVSSFRNPTGNLASSIRAGRARKHASATATAIYAAVQHWASGWPGDNTRENPYMFDAREKTMPFAVNTVSAELRKAAKKAGLT